MRLTSQQHVLWHVDQHTFSQKCLSCIWKSTVNSIAQFVSFIFSANECFSHRHIYMFTVLRVRPQSDAFLSAPKVSVWVFTAVHAMLLHLLSHKVARHILVNYKGDAAGRSDPDHVGDDAFVKADGAFVPAEKGKKMTQIGHYLSAKFTRMACWAPFVSGSVSYLHVRLMTSITPLYLLCWSCRRARTTWYGYVVATANILDNAAIVMYSSALCLYR